MYRMDLHDVSSSNFSGVLDCDGDLDGAVRADSSGHLQVRMFELGVSKDDII